MARSELTHPSKPINGQSLLSFKAVLESYLGGGEVRDLDMAMLMNVPLNRLSQLKRAKSTIETVGRGLVTDEAIDLPDGEDEVVAELPGMRPNQAILVRLLLKHPAWVPMPLRPSHPEVFTLLQPFMPGAVEDGRAPNKSGFAPLFGRSYISSYKMLSEGGDGSQGAGLPVTRLQLLVITKYAQAFANALKNLSDKAAEVPAEVRAALANTHGWALLRERDSLTDWMSDEQLFEFEADVKRRFREWFEKHYLQVLEDEAISRDVSPEQAIEKGKWTNTAAVSDQKMAAYSRATRPILGRNDSPFALFRESFGLTSAESYWVLGIQIKAFYRFRQRAEQRIDAPTSILLRYLFRYPEDIALFMPAPASGRDIYEAIRQEDPDFKLSQLAPLFGASRVMSYEFAEEGAACPFFARRLATVFSQQREKGEPIYRAIRECVEEEVIARGLDLAQFWRDGRWHR
ncbi:hypothetical protein [Marinobacter sp.]|uniref:hypothetical protein n=1 Tax=Marinobacter sp. TaxID=50741 RepID=UPI0019E4951D|nr:hypothetical protein [Marinobacter sp.]MBE0487156.1 hypothetical protein [Marinobacter sp.]